MESTDEKVKRIIADQLGVSEGEVTPSADIINDLGADSLDIVEVVMAVEDEFDLSIPDDDVEPLKTVKDVIDYVAKRKP